MITDHIFRKLALICLFGSSFVLAGCEALSSGQPLLSAPVEAEEPERSGINLTDLVQRFLPGSSSDAGASQATSGPTSSVIAPGAAAVIGPSAVGSNGIGVGGNAQSGTTYSGDFSRFGPGPNVHLWRASLEVLSFMPMALADPVTGLIQTNWYNSPSNGGERIRAEIYVLSDQLREDALRANVYRQMYNQATGQWVNAPTNPTTASQLENRILGRALERQSSVGQR